MDRSGRSVYVTNNGSNDIPCFTADPANGRLTPIATVAAGTGTSGAAIVSTFR